MAHISNLTFQDWDDYTLEAEDGFMDSSKYSTPENESDKRRQLQTQHSQLRDFINETMIVKINALDDGEESITTNYALKSESGKTLTFSYSAANSNRLTITLVSGTGTVLDTKTVDLALGKMLTGLSYDSVNKRLIATYVQNGSTGSDAISIAALLTGYATENWVLGKAYETIAAVDVVRGRVSSLETFQTVTVPTTYETIANVNAHKNNTTVHVTSDEKAAWNGKQVTLEAGAFIIIEDLPNGHQKISAANGTISVDYRNATNKPYINGVELNGNKSFMDLGLPFSFDSDGNICMEE